MNQRRFPSAVALGLGMALAAGAQANGDAVAGKEKFDTCTGCHGIPGYHNVYPTYRVPKVAGQNAAYIVAALNGYKNGSRPHKTMQSQAVSLGDDDIADIAAYLASLGQR